MTEIERLIELLKDGGVRDFPYVNALADHLLANGVIVPPCKVGDTVYVCFSRTRVIECKVARIIVEHIEEIGMSFICYGGMCFDMRHWGKTVFLTREEDGKGVGGNEQNMNFTFGRENLALTVFVPWDCENACEFCTSKRSYSMNPGNVDRVIYQLRNIFLRYHFPIKDVVISGGEPMMNIRELRSLCMEIPDDKNIYINTTLVNRNLEEFLDFLNNGKKINGVNISRHGNTIEDDRKMFCNIADDSVIQQIKVPVKINCLNGIGDLDRVLNRWSGTGVHLCIREDYRNVKMFDTRNLHDPFAEIPMRLKTLGYLFLSHTGCRVCDTLTFEKDNDIVSYHRGLPMTSIEFYDELEINDLVIDQSGLFSYDWGFPKADVLYQLEEAFRKPVDMFRNFENIGIRSKIEYCGSKSGC